MASSSLALQRLHESEAAAGPFAGRALEPSNAPVGDAQTLESYSDRLAPYRRVVPFSTVASQLTRLPQPTATISSVQRQALRREFPHLYQRPKTGAVSKKALGHWHHVMTNGYAPASLSFTMGYWFLRAHNFTVRSNMKKAASAKVPVVADVTFWANRFATCWLLSEAFALLLHPLAAQWKQTAYDQFSRQARQDCKDSIIDWANPQKRARLNAAIATQGPKDFDVAVDFVLSCASNATGLMFYLFNADRSLLVGMYPIILVPMGIALALLVGNNKMVQQRLTHEEYLEENKLRSIAHDFADNQQLSNAHNQRRWNAAYEVQTTRYKAASWKRLCNKVGAETILTGIVALPAMLSTAFSPAGLGSLNKGAPSKELFKVAERMLLLMEINHRVSGLMVAISLQSSVASRLRNLNQAVYADTTRSWNQRVDRMLVNRERIAIVYEDRRVNPDVLLKNPRLLLRKGMWEFRAANGVGKTTILNALQSTLTGEYDYIPVQHRLHFTPVAGSAGETAIYQLAEAIKNLRKPILMLDEPAANLDPRNTQKIYEFLQQVAQSRSVVMVVPA